VCHQRYRSVLRHRLPPPPPLVVPSRGRKGPDAPRPGQAPDGGATRVPLPDVVVTTRRFLVRREGKAALGTAIRDAQRSAAGKKTRPAEQPTVMHP
jgi:hypothetical protein